MEGAKETVYLKNKDGTQGKRYRVYYRCNQCKKLFELKEVQVDHIKCIGHFPNPFNAGELLAWWNRLNCGKENLQVLDKACHKLKSKKEKTEGYYE